MNSVSDFIITPTNERYNNKISIGDKTLIVNSNIEDHRMVSRHATVVSMPLAYKFNIQKGDQVIIHHNIFRRWYDIKGNQRNSSQYFKDDLYFCKPDQIYLHKKGEKWLPFMDRCFVMPIKDNNNLSTDKEQKCVGILKIGNNALDAHDRKLPAVETFQPAKKLLTKMLEADEICL